MFFSVTLTSRQKGGLGVIWMASHGRKLTKNEILNICISASCKKISQPDVPMALRCAPLVDTCCASSGPWEVRQGIHSHYSRSLLHLMRSAACGTPRSGVGSAAPAQLGPRSRAHSISNTWRSRIASRMNRNCSWEAREAGQALSGCIGLEHFLNVPCRLQAYLASGVTFVLKRQTNLLLKDAERLLTQLERLDGQSKARQDAASTKAHDKKGTPRGDARTEARYTSPICTCTVPMSCPMGATPCTLHAHHFWHHLASTSKPEAWQGKLL